MRYMVIEEFVHGPGPVYRRLAASGRGMPAGLHYVGSWITEDMTRCYQVMECDDRALLEAWMAEWRDLMAFEVIPVITSPEAVARAAAADRARS